MGGEKILCCSREPEVGERFVFPRRHALIPDFSQPEKGSNFREKCLIIHWTWGGTHHLLA